MTSTKADARSSRLWLEGAVFVALVVLLLVEVLGHYAPHSFLHGDGAFYANINRSLKDGFTLVQGDIHPRSWIEQELGWNHSLDQGWSNVSLGADGETWYPKHPYLMPLVSTPFYVLFGMTGLLVFNVLMTVLLLFFSFRVAARFAHPAAAAVVTLLLAGSPVVLSSAYSYSNDVFYAALLMMGLEGMLARRWVLAGVLMGMAVWAKVTNVFVVAPLAVWFLFSEGWRPIIVRFGLGFSVPVAVFAVGNWIMFGAPWTTSYDRILIREDGLIALESARVRFGTPLGQGLRAILGTGHSGLLRKAPLAVLAFAGLVPLFWRRLGLAIALLVSFVAYALFFAPYEYVYARFFLPWFGLCVVCGAVGLEALGAGLRRLGRWFGEPRRVLVVVGAALVAVVLGVWLVQAFLPGERRRVSERIREADVSLGPLPCDYYNNSLDAWECAQRERHNWEYVARPLDGRCRAEGFPSEALWLHPSPSKKPKRVRFDALPPTSQLRVVAMRAPGQKGRGEARLELRAGGASLLTLSPSVPGEVLERRVASPALAKGDGALELVVTGPAGSRSGLGLCVEVYLEATVAD